MSNQLQLSGAQSVKPTHRAPIFTNRFFQGLWTQRNPLRDAGSTRIEEKFYGARGDAMIGGSNIEISNRLTPVRRPGLSVYNSASFTAVDYFYEFRQFTATSETITVMVDTAAALYNGTGPSTKNLVWSKSSGAGQTYMQSVGNTLYFGNGVDQKKWMQPPGWMAQTSLAMTQYEVGTTVIDSNGNLEYLSSAGVGNITNVAVLNKIATLTFNNTNFNVSTGMDFVPMGLTGASFLNGLTLIASSAIPSGSTFIVTAFADHVNYTSTADSGSASTSDVGTPTTTGGSAPSWSVIYSGVTVDGLSTWINFSTPVFNWGAPAAPAQAPTLSQPFGSPLGTTGIWQASTVINQQTTIIDSQGDIQTTTSPAATGSTYPTFTPAASYTSWPFSTVDGAATWFGSAWFGAGTGRSGPTNWVPATTIHAAQVAGGDVCVDSNGNLQLAISALPGNVSGAVAPTWNTTYGGTTLDNGGGGGGGISWRNIGPYLALAFQGWEYGYAYHCVDQSVSTLSPLTPSTVGVLSGVIIGGSYSTDPQVDAIWIFRTTDGGSIPLFLASIPNNHAGGMWNYVDQNHDSNLDIFVEGPQADANNPPPAGLINLTYHLGRIFGSVENVVYWSNGPDTITGNGNTAWPPLNSATFPSRVARIVANSMGAIVFTISDIYLITGQGTPTSPLFSTPYAQGIGLLSYNALAVSGTTIYLFTTDSQVISLEPSSGVSQVGFPIGDQFELSNWSPATAYVSWHVSGSQDHALYVADGSTGWFRMSPTAAPESGLTWSPFATIAGGAGAVRSVEVSPGVHQLLVGPAGTGPILKRDLNVWTDNGTPYSANFAIGSIVLAQPGQIATLDFLTTDATAIGSAPVPGVLVDEIAGNFEALAAFTPDPPQLPRSTSTYNQRFYFAQTQQPALCRHCQVNITWPPENFQNELLSMTIFGGFMQED